MKRLAAGAAVLLLTAVHVVAGSGVRAAAERYRAAHEGTIVGMLCELTRIRSVAADPQGLAAAASWLERQLEARGFATARFTEGGAPPLVFGSYRVPGARRTVVFYAHYDGQPVKPERWSSDPFVPTMRSGPPGPGARAVDWRVVREPLAPDWRLFARAVADDKASVVAFLAAFDALRAAGREPSVNLAVAWEGEEEEGSPHLRAILEAHESELRSDLWLIGDGPVHQSGRQALYFGARGFVGVQATVYGPLRAVHDGHYGNWVPNPAALAAQLVVELRDDHGRVRVPGFDDDVRPLTEAERAAIAALPPVEDELREELGLAASEGGDGLTMSTMRPALNVRGIRAGRVGPESTNAIPTEADVSMDVRLVPDQTPERVKAKVEAYLGFRGWTVVREAPDLAFRLAHPRIVRLVWEEGYPALRSDMTSPAARAVIAAARSAADGEVALLPMMGGSVPIHMLHAIFGAPVIGVPIANHDDSQHAPDENLRLGNLWDGVATYAAMIGELRW